MPQTEPMPSPSEERDPPQERARVILAVDRFPSKITQLLQSLEVIGYKTRVARNCAQALILTAQVPPDLILLDADLGGSSSYDFCSQLKAYPTTYDIPVVFIGDDTQEFERVEGFSVGAVDFIPRPLNMLEALMRIEQHLRTHQAGRSLQAQLADCAATVQQFQKEKQSLLLLVNVDALTQTANRRYFDEYLLREWRRSRLICGPISLIMCDVDCFKAYNDTYGHTQGDLCLQRISAVLMESVRKPLDVVARYGGEEFAIILPNTNLDGALHFAGRIRDNIQSLAIRHEHSACSTYVTLSMGVVSTFVVDETPAFLLETADRCLYQAKREGRDRICSLLLDQS
ncbi:MAG: diguanylate cyclase [Oscillatoriales cyanobacterium SM2_2_1]|nr:diguanylate cyclase [Oscillatoriales cyanobacterium SM2_2_1]